MEESIRDLLVRGMAAAKAREGEEARFYLEWALRLDPPLDQRVEAWYWLSQVCADPVEKRRCLEEVLACQPGHQPAQRSLAVLDGRLDPAQMVDPDRLPAPALEPVDTIQSRRFVCPQCGGRMVFRPDGLSLTCEYCDQDQQIRSTPVAARGRVAQGDFTVAMATAQGHTRPVAMNSFECRACGAVFLLSPNTLSLTCPYCASIYVIETTENRMLIPPDWVIPFAIEKTRASSLLRSWSSAGGHEHANLQLSGLYLPVWYFTISGGRLFPDRPTIGKYKQPEPEESDFFLLEDVLVPASKSQPGLGESFFVNYDYKQAVPYNPAYLAEWPAETYQITLAEASLAARLKLIQRTRALANLPTSSLPGAPALRSMDLLIHSYQLILVPLWFARSHSSHPQDFLAVNAQTGDHITGRPGKTGWLSGLFTKD